MMENVSCCWCPQLPEIIPRLRQAYDECLRYSQLPAGITFTPPLL